MKNFAVLTTFLVVTLFSQVHAFQLNGREIERIKVLTMQTASIHMQKRNFIKNRLNDKDFNSILIGIETLKPKYDQIEISSQIYPAENNCDCQDIFEFRLMMKKENGHWRVQPYSILAWRMDDHQ